jgi:hypothetical protein
MAKLIFGLGFATSLAILAVATVGPPTSASASHETAQTGCSVETLPLDEGYGVSRMGLRRNCAG